jgi:hypothetical protein
MKVYTLAITPVKLRLVRKWMKLWTFVASNPKKGQKNNYWTQFLSIISDSRDKGVG